MHGIKKIGRHARLGENRIIKGLQNARARACANHARYYAQ